MGKYLIIDTREKKDKNKHITDYFDEQGIHYTRSKLLCGDYTFTTNQTVCIDRKQNINEICMNVCQSHKRFTDEIKRAIENDIKLYFLIEDNKVRKLEDLKEWENPRKYISNKATKGEQLYKILKTIEDRYNTKFYFCNKAETGQKIIEILEAK